jgi:multidrug efflux system membrane fusion protein
MPSTRSWRWLIAALAAAVLAGAGYATFSGGSAGAKNPKAQRPPAPVVVAEASQRTVPVRLSTIGTAQARSTVSIKSRVDGQLLEAHFQEGQTVRKDDLLFRIDPRPFAAQLRQAEANLARDQAQLERVRADLKRYGELAEKGYSSRQKYEEALATANALDATIRADAAAIDFAKLQLDYTSIHSPITGRTGSLLVNPGNLVKANDTAALVVIVETQPIYVSFALPEAHLSEIKRRMAAGKLTVEVSIPQDAAPPPTGEVFFVNNAVDVATGTIGLKAVLENKDDRLTHGQFVNVNVTMSTLRDAVVVPSQAIQTGQKGTFVFVVKPDSIVEQRSVTVGVSVDGVTVVQDGLKAGEKVVTEGQLRLAPGVKVAPKSVPTS